MTGHLCTSTNSRLRMRYIIRSTVRRFTVHLAVVCPSVIFVNENENKNGLKRENNIFVNKN